MMSRLVLVELQACNHPRVGSNRARAFYAMANADGLQEWIDGEAKFVGVKVSEHKLEDLDRVAKTVNRSRSALIREAIDRYLEQEVAA